MKSQSQIPTNKGLVETPIINCYIIKPVPGNSEYYWPEGMTFSNNIKSLDSTLSNLNKVKFDSLFRFVTSFEYQKKILINYDCYSWLSKPDSCDLLNLYFNSGFQTKKMTKSNVQFVKTYDKNILNFGPANVFEYMFDGVSEVEPNYMFIIVKKPSEEDNRFKEDYKGYVICSDGLDWKEQVNERNVSIPLFILKLRGAKELIVPLLYDGQRYIPIGHFKKGD